MATPTSRATLIEYCKRRLGDPVIEINVDDDQVEDRVDEALQYYQEYHSDATIRTYLKHQITATDVSNEYITLSNNILFVSKMFPLESSFNQSRNFFDIKFIGFILYSQIIFLNLFLEKYIKSLYSIVPNPKPILSSCITILSTYINELYLFENHK